MTKYLNTYYDQNGNPIFHYHFPSLSSLIDYLKTAPIYKASFYRLFSEELNKRDDRNDRGEPFDITLEHMISGYRETYSEYREKSQVDRIKIDVPTDFTRVKNVRSYVGSRVDVQAYANGIERCMIKPVRRAPKKQITVNYELSYKGSITREQVMNRGMIAMLIVKALEQSNFNVDLNCYVLLQEELVKDEKQGKLFKEEKTKKEIFYMTINLKELNLPLNELKCIGPMMRIEFLKRCIFRLIETTPLDRVWNNYYGHEVPEQERDRIIKAGLDDITFASPYKMNIKGKDLEEDLQNSIDYLNLNNIISLRKRLK